MKKYSIFNRRVVIEKKSEFDHFFKVQISREVIFLVCKIDIKGDSWNLIDKGDYDFWENKSELTTKEEKEILDFVRFKILFENCKHSLDQDCPSLIVTTEDKKRSKDGADRIFWDYVKELHLKSQASESLDCQVYIRSVFNGVIVPNGTNFPLAVHSFMKNNTVSIKVGARKEWIAKTIGEFTEENYYSGIYGNLATTWFVTEVLPKYYMREFMRI